MKNKKKRTGWNWQEIDVYVPVHIAKFLEGYYGGGTIIVSSNYHDRVLDFMVRSEQDMEAPKDKHQKIVRAKLPPKTMKSEGLFEERSSATYLSYIYEHFFHVNLNMYVAAKTEDGLSIVKACQLFLKKYNIEEDDYALRDATESFKRFKKYTSNGLPIK